MIYLILLKQSGKKQVTLNISLIHTKLLCFNDGLNKNFGKILKKILKPANKFHPAFCHSYKLTPFR